MSGSFTTGAGACVRVHTLVLRRCGFLRLAPHAPPRERRTHEMYRCFALGCTSTYVAQQATFAYLERANMDKLAQVMFLLLCHVTSLAKQLVFFRGAGVDRIDALIAGLDDPLYGGAEAASELRRVELWASRFLSLYAGAAVLTCTLWIVFPLLAHARGLPVEFFFWMPFECSDTPRFALVLLYSYYMTSLIALANTTMDAFIATILKQCKTQLKILRMNLQRLPARAARAGGSGGARGARGARGAGLDALFRESMAHYHKITQDVFLLQDIFGTAILIQFAVSGLILCMAAYKIVSMSILSIQFASTMLFILCILTELFLYCFYGNEVIFESDRLVESMYCMEWRALPPRLQRALLTLMERAKRPLRPLCGGLVPLSLDTFIKVIKFSYSFYAMLNETK